MSNSKRKRIQMDAPDVSGWSWKQIIMGGFGSIAIALNDVARAIDHQTAQERSDAALQRSTLRSGDARRRSRDEAPK